MKSVAMKRSPFLLAAWMVLVASAPLPLEHRAQLANSVDKRQFEIGDIGTSNLGFSDAGGSFGGASLDTSSLSIPGLPDNGLGDFQIGSNQNLGVNEDFGSGSGSSSANSNGNFDWLSTATNPNNPVLSPSNIDVTKQYFKDGGQPSDLVKTDSSGKKGWSDIANAIFQAGYKIAAAKATNKRPPPIPHIPHPVRLAVASRPAPVVASQPQQAQPQPQTAPAQPSTPQPQTAPAQPSTPQPAPQPAVVSPPTKPSAPITPVPPVAQAVPPASPPATPAVPAAPTCNVHCLNPNTPDLFNNCQHTNCLPSSSNSPDSDTSYQLDNGSVVKGSAIINCGSDIGTDQYCSAGQKINVAKVVLNAE